MNSFESVTPEDIGRASQSFFSDRANVVAKNAVTAKGVRAVARVPERAAQNTTVFDVEVKAGGRTDQKRSGRCWMFASLNTMRMRTIERFGLKDFELSQAYPLFWDKLEKSNWFFENIIDTVDQPVSGRLVSFLLTDPVSDGGQWDMFKALVKKYGVVPKEAMPESASSSNTRDLDGYLTRFLRATAHRLRSSYEAGADVAELRAAKKDAMAKVYAMLVTCLGEPPARFDVRLRDKDDKLALAGSFTPQEFYQQAVGLNLDDYVSLISAPTADKPFGRTYTVSRLGNVVEAGGVRYLNLPPEALKQAAIRQLKAGLPVWFGCDVDQSFIQEEGIMDLDALAIDQLFGFEVMGGFDKAARLDYGESLMTHAMVLEGVNLSEEGRPTLWKVENSWGKDHAKDGFDTLADTWFDEYVYQVVVDRAHLEPADAEAFDSIEPIVLEPWDPMGALAR
ncbi:C1 family peptidase [Eggerthellaceae bacterium zg-997]|nr:C1 family peptidase [Eggerthellaceae bacterium zg-997]